jgi:Na+-transporting NADH:ubiquinone oxidoreductase subunit NqrB
MKAIRNLFDALRPRFEEGGPYHKLYAFYESIETVFSGRSSARRPSPRA